MSHPTFVEADLEKGTTINGSNDEVNDDQFQTSKLDRVGTIVLTPEMFEKLYFQPQNKVSGNLRSTFGNPTAIATLGLALSVTPFACAMFGWMGSDPSGASFLGVFLFTGGLLMFLGGILEFFIGNTFPFLVFCSMGGFFFSLASTSIPAFGVQGAFATAEYSGAHENPAFYSTFAFYPMFVGFMHFIYFIASLRTNIVLLCTFFTATLSLELLSAEYFMIGQGDMVKAEGFQHATGVVLLMLGALSWYLFASLVLESVDFPIVLPVGNLSMKIVGRSQSVRQRA